MKKILIIEDNKFLLSLLRAKFLKENFEVFEAEDGLEGIKKIEEIKPDIILLDIILPEKKGFEVMKEVKENPALSKIPIVIISNLAQPEDLEKGKKLGALAYFVKSQVSIEEIVKKIKEILAKQNFSRSEVG